MTQQHNYWRADITGLRALAVIPVVLYHAFPGLMPGGFVGVDIFFVISGYLISGIIFRSLIAKNKVDYVDFYAKRIRRILPNLLLLLSFCLVVGYFFLFDDELKELSKQVEGVINFVSSGYNDGPLRPYSSDTYDHEKAAHDAQTQDSRNTGRSRPFPSC